MTAERDALAALGVIGDGYCFCSKDRDPHKSVHEPECRDARAVLAAQPTAAPAQGEAHHLTRDEQQMLGRALRASAREVPAQGEPKDRCPHWRGLQTDPEPCYAKGCYTLPTQGEPQDYDELAFDLGRLGTSTTPGWRAAVGKQSADAIAALRATVERQAREIRTLRNVAVTADERAERAEAERDAMTAEPCKDCRTPTVCATTGCDPYHAQPAEPTAAPAQGEPPATDDLMRDLSERAENDPYHGYLHRQASDAIAALRAENEKTKLKETACLNAVTPPSDNDQSGVVASATREDAGMTHCSPASDSPGVTLSTPPDPTSAPAQGEPRHLTRDEQQMLGRALRASAREVTAQGEPQPVLRFACFTQEDGVYESPTGEHVAYADYAALRAEIERQARERSDMSVDIEKYRNEIAELKSERDAAQRAGVTTANYWMERAELAEDQRERTRDVWATRAERAEAECEKLREVVKAADAMRTKLAKRSDDYRINAYDAARAKVQP